MKRFYWFFMLYGFVAVCCFPVSSMTPYAPDIAQFRPLSPQAEVSLITCSPSEDAVFTVYGHTALRVFDPLYNIDRVFNYGSFEFSKPNFIYRFAKGETDYKLETSDFKIFLTEQMYYGREVYEQILNLLHAEKEALWNALMWNALPENRVYRYNFFFDNCATRPADMIENNIQGALHFSPPTTGLPSFRGVINDCTRYRSWQTFGCDLVLGLPTDRIMTQKETFFIPENLKNTFNEAQIIREGNAAPLVKKINILAKEDLPPKITTPFLFAPVFCFSAFFVLILALTIVEWRRKIYYRLIDVLLFFVAGIAGFILFYLSFLSVHPCTFPNISLFWLHPLQLIGVVLFSVKKFKKSSFWYHFINFAVIIIMSVAWFFIPQHLNMAFIPLIACLWLRSGGALVRKKYTTE